MYKYPGQIPEIESSMPEKRKDGIRHALKLVPYVEEGLESGSLPLHLGQLNRKKLAEEVGFGRSAYEQNPYIEDIAKWAEKMLGQKPRTGGSAGKTERERELANENERLKNRNIALKTELDEAFTKLQRLGYMEKTLESGDARLPW
jgi:hypothetical protein